MTLSRRSLPRKSPFDTVYDNNIYMNKFPQSAKIRCHVDVINLFTCSIAVCECVARTSTCIYVIMLSSMARCSDSNRHSSSHSDLNRSQN